MLATDRLLLRRFTEHDLDSLYQHLYSDPEVVKTLAACRSLTREQTAALLHRRLDHWQTYGFGALALIHKQNGQLIGHCGLHSLKNQTEIELTYAISRNYWRQGFATEASTAVLQWGFKTLGFEAIVAVTGLTNIASQRVMQKLGMQYQGNRFYNGSEVVCYGIANSSIAKSSPLN